MPGTARPRRRRDDRLLGLLGRIATLPRGKILLLHGTRGIGKTSIALTAFPCPHVASSEMDPQELLRYARRVRARLAGVSSIQVEEEEGGVRVDLGISRDAQDLVVDSLTATAADAAAMREIEAWCDATGGRAVVVLQATKAGDYAGSSSIAHAADVEAQLVAQEGARKLVLVKNRFGALADLDFVLGAQGPVPPSRARYYSVEGKAGAYRLLPHPTPGALRAGYLVAVDRERAEGGSSLQLPPAPCAVSAASSALYPGGWVEPEDGPARASYALAQGVPYYSPVEGP